jgi:hypothetical protein
MADFLRWRPRLTAGAGTASRTDVRTFKPYVYGGDPPPLPAWYAELRARIDAQIAAHRQENGNAP